MNTRVRDTAFFLTTFALMASPVAAVGKSATTTTLWLSAGAVSTGVPVTLIAQVTNPGKVTQGLVKFCNQSAAHCEDAAVLGTAQLTSAGKAQITLLLGVGTHSIAAVYVGSSANSASTSISQTLTPQCHHCFKP